MQKLVFLGVGANNTDILDAVERTNAIEPTYDVIGYVSGEGSPARVETPYPRLGDPTVIRSLDADVQIAGFNFGPDSYRQWPGFIEGLGLAKKRFATIIDPRAVVSPTSTVGHGSVVLAGSVVGAHATIGDHVIVLQNVGISHDDKIGDCTCIAVGASFSGGVRVGRNCFVGANSTIIRGPIGEGSMIGAGSLIRCEVPPNEVWVGNPGRKLRKAGD